MDVITLRYAGHTVIVSPPVNDLLRQFATTDHVAESDAQHGLRIVPQLLPLVWPDTWLERPIMRSFAGLEGRIKAWLENAGYQVRLTGDRPSRLPRPRETKSGGCCPDDSVLEFLRRHERGVIRYNPAHVQVDRLIAEVAEAYPKKRILVVTSRQNDVHYLGHQLRGRGFKLGLAHYGREARGRHRIAVVTMSCVGTGTADAANRDFVFYLNPDQLLCRRGLLGLGCIRGARVYGLMPDGKLLPSPQNGFIDAVFGEQSVYLPRHGRTARSVQVAMVPSRVGNRSMAAADNLSARRRLIWDHPVRNRRIAQVAKAFVREDYDMLDGLFRGLGWVARKRRDGYVAVLVDSVEHALALARHLPGWAVHTRDQADTQGLSRSDASRIGSINCTEKVVPRNAIVTASEMPVMTHFDVIIRADGGVDLPQLAGPHLLTHDDTDDPLLLIDFDDRHHPLARKWTRSRIAAYLERDWSVVGGPEVYVENRICRSARIGQPVLPYQTPGEYRAVAGEYRTARWQYEKRRERRREQLSKEAEGRITLKQVADPDHLMDCVRKLVREGGPAAGVDGISPGDISMSNFVRIVKQLSAALMEKRWRPQRTRLQPIPKPGTDEKRILKIGVALDRVVGKALHESLQPFWEKAYLRNSFGFRPGRSVWQMVAELGGTMEKHDRWVLVIADVRKAFDNVPIAKALQAHRVAAANVSKGKRLILTDDVMELIETVLRGHDQAHNVGIDQGGCYSPDALNIFLHTVHDSPLDAVDDAPLWFRYADNLVYLVQSVSEGRRVLTRVRRLLRKAGLSLKGDERIVDLNTAKDNPATVLGLSLWREDGRLRIGLGKDYLSRLGEHLVKAWETSDPNKTAKTVLRGWINANGPAFENGAAAITDILRHATRLGFRELPGADAVQGWWEESWQRWLACRRRARHRVMQRIRH